MRLKFSSKIEGQLLAELDLFFKKHHRRPDMCWLTDSQIDNLAEDKYEVPLFTIEVISKNDQVNKLEGKMNDYREAGVKVAWQIFPQHQTVHVYTGKKLKNMKDFSQIFSLKTLVYGQ